MTVSDLEGYSGGFSFGPKDGVKCIWFETVKGIEVELCAECREDAGRNRTSSSTKQQDSGRA